MKSADIRKQFLSYFEGHGHTVVPSASLVPHDDPTLFFVNAGMVPFKDTFTGKEQRPYSRAASAQKCLRVSGKHNDLENVGRTPRHHTLFEMLGNFSFGDYFKAEAIPMAWELLTGVYGLDPARLWVTVYEEDDEAWDLWRSTVDFPAERLQRMGAKENFWSMGDTGPCGPCTEIHYDHGPTAGPPGGPATDSSRYVEIWNLVFMQFDQAADGTRTPLPRPSIDTGMGLERLTAAIQGVYWNYDTDLFSGLMARAAQEADVRYRTDADTDVALRVIADHARATAFLVADGIMPSNEGRGYVLRRVMRRAIRFGVKLGLERPFFHDITGQVIADFGAAYPELRDRSAFVGEVVAAEEERFRRTLDRGMRLLDRELENAPAGAVLDGQVAFTLSDTYGFPLDLTQLIAAERGVGVDAAGYERALEVQREAGRKAWKGSGEQAVAALWHDLSAGHGATDFTGYDRDEDQATIIAMVRQDGDERALVDRLEAGQQGIALLDRTPFYAESGGQVGDHGSLSSGPARATVADTTTASGLSLHHVTVEAGSLGAGDAVVASVDGGRRDHTRRNHTATHLLHAALKAVLGEHVNQKGSLVAPDRLRFDFAHHKPMSTGELAQVEDLVNAQVLANRALQTRVEDLEAAKAGGAMALFGEKYDDQVRVVDIPGFSVELCGGTHVARTGDIGLFRLTSETGIAAGVRRIEAQTGHGSLALVRAQADTLADGARRLKTDPERLGEAIARLQAQRRELERELAAARTELARHAAADVISGARELGDVKLLAAEIDGDLREQADRLRDQLGTSVVVLARRAGPKALLLVACSKDIAGKRVHAGKVVKELAPMVGGGGGGRPDLAQAGGKNPDGIPAALERAHEVVAQMLA